MKKLLLAFLALCSVASATATNDHLDWLLTGSGGLIAMPPVSVTDGDVGRVSWSPDGAYVFVAERPNVLTQEQALMTGSGYAQGMLHLLVWDKEFQRVRVMWTTEDASQKIESIDWIHGTSAAYITLRWTTQDSPNTPAHAIYGVIWLDANSGKYLWVAGLEHLIARPHINPSPTRALVAVVFSDNPSDDSADFKDYVVADLTRAAERTFSVVIQADSNTLARTLSNSLLSSFFKPQNKANNYWTLDGAGGIKSSIKLDHILELPLIWNQDGSAWFLQQMDQATGKQGLFRLTPQGALEKTDETEFTSTAKHQTLSLESKAGTTELGKSKVSFASLWLKSVEASDHSEFILTPNGDWPELSPTEGAVFYIDGGVAKVRSLIALPKGQMKRIQDSAKESASAINVQEVKYQLKLSIFGGGSEPPAKP